MEIETRQFKNNTALFLLLFCLLYLPGLCLSPLSMPEAVAALGQLDAATFSSLGRSFMTGDRVTVHKFFSVMVKFFSFFLGGGEFAARLPSVVAILILCAASALMGRRYGGRNGAMVAAVTCACAITSINAGGNAGGHAVTAAFITSAWFCWYVFGREAKRWGLAWGTALAIVVVASLHAGIKVFMLFYFPLLFLRRPVKIWRRFAMARHLTMLIAAIALCLLFQAGMNGTPVTVESITRWYGNGSDLAVGMADIMLYPFRWFVFMMPALILFWPGFCAAFKPLEGDNQLGGFLRTITVAFSIAILVIPNSKAHDFVILAAPLSVLASIHCELLLRRHRRIIECIVSVAWRIASVIAMVALAGVVAIVLGVVELQAVSFGVRFFAAVMIVVAAGMLLLIPRYCPSQAVWLRMAVLVIAVQLLVSGTVRSWHHVFDGEARDRGMEMRAVLPVGVRVYNLSQLPLAREKFYLNRKIVELSNVGELPVTPETVYVMAGNDPPLTDDRVWQAVTERFAIDIRYRSVIEWLPAGMKVVRVTRVVDDGALPTASRVVRIYRGIKRPEGGGVSPVGSVSPAS